MRRPVGVSGSGAEAASPPTASQAQWNLAAAQSPWSPVLDPLVSVTFSRTWRTPSSFTSTGRAADAPVSFGEVHSTLPSPSTENATSP